MFELLPIKEIVEAETKLERFARDLINKYLLEDGIKLENAVRRVEDLTNTKISLGASGKSFKKRKFLFQTRVFSQEGTDFPYCLWIKLSRPNHDAFFTKIVGQDYIINRTKGERCQNMNSMQLT